MNAKNMNSMNYATQLNNLCLNNERTFDASIALPFDFFNTGGQRRAGNLVDSHATATATATARRRRMIRSGRGNARDGNDWVLDIARDESNETPTSWNIQMLFGDEEITNTHGHASMMMPNFATSHDLRVRSGTVDPTQALKRGYFETTTRTDDDYRNNNIDESRTEEEKGKTTRSPEELAQFVRMHGRFREYVEIMISCRKLTAQTRTEREALDRQDRAYLEKLDEERRSYNNTSSFPPSPSIASINNNHNTSFSMGSMRGSIENDTLCTIPDFSFQQDNLLRICEDTKFKAELDGFMDQSCKNARKFQIELMAIYDETEKACETFEKKIKELTLTEKKTILLNTTTSDGNNKETLIPKATKRKLRDDEEENDEEKNENDSMIDDDKKDAEEEDGSMFLCKKSDKAFRDKLLEKYKDNIPALEEEWLNKKPKGKLPNEALVVLKEFWNERICWPYPTEDDKAAIKEKTTLDSTQVNNWFINQRKRHWLRMFKHGQTPISEEESRLKLLEKFGTLDAAIEFCNRNTK